MAKTYWYLTWWQWCIVLLAALNNLITGPPVSSMGGLLGTLLGSVVGVYAVVAFLAYLWREVISSKKEQEPVDEGPSDEYLEWRRAEQ